MDVLDVLVDGVASSSSSSSHSLFPSFVRFALVFFSRRISRPQRKIIPSPSDRWNTCPPVIWGGTPTFGGR